MSVIVARPPRSRVLAPFVERLWLHRGEFSHLLPSGRMQLLVNLQEDVLCD